MALRLARPEAVEAAATAAGVKVAPEVAAESAETVKTVVCMAITVSLSLTVM